MVKEKNEHHTVLELPVEAPPTKDGVRRFKKGLYPQKRKKWYQASLKKDSFLQNLLTYFLLAFFGVTMLVPFFWMVSTSLKDPGSVFEFPPRWIPAITTQYYEVNGEKIPIRIIREYKETDTVRVKTITDDPSTSQYLNLPREEVKKDWKVKIVWENYPKAWKAIEFGRGYVNSLFIAITITLGQVLTSSMAAYAFARLVFPMRDQLFLAYLATMMIPRAVTMIPVFILLKKMPEIMNFIFHTTYWSSDLYIGNYFIGKPIGIDSYFALIMPGLFSAYGTFMLRQFFMSIPSDLEDAAKIDGCSLFGIYWRIILPLSKPALATLITFTFMGAWREFMWPLVVANSQEMMPLPVLLASFQGLYTTDWTLLMAGSIIVLLPVVLIFILSQRFFIEGIQLGAVKG